MQSAERAEAQPTDASRAARAAAAAANAALRMPQDAAPGRTFSGEGMPHPGRDALCGGGSRSSRTSGCFMPFVGPGAGAGGGSQASRSFPIENRVQTHRFRWPDFVVR